MIEDKEENIFGKVRGRFDEMQARRCDRSLPTAAMAAIVPMPPEEFAQFVAVFNKTFGEHGASRFMIVPVQKG